MSRGHSLIANMILYVNASTCIYMEILEMILLCFSIQGEDILLKHINGKCDVFTFWYARGR